MLQGRTAFVTSPTQRIGLAGASQRLTRRDRAAAPAPGSVP